MSDLVEKVQQAIGSTELMVPGSLRDLLCTTTYANDHVIALLLKDAAHAAILAVLDGIAEPSEAMKLEGSTRLYLSPKPPYIWLIKAADVYRAMIAALRKEIANV